MSNDPAAAGGASDPADALRSLFDSALPNVYGYLLARCGRVATAEDLTGETFLAAADAVRRDGAAPVSTPWLIGVARHKLLDHWRRQAREDRNLRAASGPDGPEPADDPWDVELDAMHARETLAQLAPHHRAALMLRYLDDLPVARVAELLERGVHSTEGLLVRARAAFRRAYQSDTQEDGDG